VPRLVGRDTEPATLADSVAHRPALVLVEGEAGISKARLLQEFLAPTACLPHRSR
jgi:predicted ATPase